MRDIEVSKRIKIEGRKHFNLILRDLKTVNDILLNIDQLCRHAAKRGKMEMLQNCIRLKAPEIHRAFAEYKSIYKPAIFDVTGCLKCPPTVLFGVWAEDKKLISVELIEGAKSGVPFKKYSVYIGSVPSQKSAKSTFKKRKKDACPSCPYCGKKFRPDSGATLATHSCRKTSTESDSADTRSLSTYIRVVSGGGCNGIRNHR